MINNRNTLILKDDSTGLLVQNIDIWSAKITLTDKINQAKRFDGLQQIYRWLDGFWTTRDLINLNKFTITDLKEVLN